jgi:Domain of unknown function (DUF1707)
MQRRAPCHHRRRTPNGVGDAVTEPVRPEDMRASDADRHHIQDRLRRAHEVGQLDLHEFDERVRSAWAARTRGELAAVVADLPVPASPPPVRRDGAVFARTAGGVAMQVLTIIWVALTALNATAWGIVTLTVGDAVYPWWLWVAGPPGAVLAVLYAAGIGRPRRGNPRC